MSSDNEIHEINIKIQNLTEKLIGLNSLECELHDVRNEFKKKISAIEDCHRLIEPFTEHIGIANWIKSSHFELLGRIVACESGIKEILTHLEAIFERVFPLDKE